VTGRGSQATSLPAWQVVNVLVYYVLGLVVLGQVHYAALRQDWQARKTPVTGGIEAKWWRSSLIFVGLVAVVALLLPTGYTTAVLDVLRFGLAVVLRALYVVAATLLFVVSLPVWYLSRWLLGSESAAPRAPPIATIRPPAAPPPGAGPAWLGIARIVFFWLLVLGFVFYLLRTFWREHPEFRQALASFRPLRWLLRLWRAWMGRVSSWGVLERLRRRREGRQAGGESEGAGETLLAQRAPDSNRGRVLYYYLDIVRRARRAGVPRRPAQTPFAYGVTLKETLPETGQQVDVLTEAFVEARYSRHRIEGDLVRRVRASWRRIKQFLGGKRENHH